VPGGRRHQPPFRILPGGRSQALTAVVPGSAPAGAADHRDADQQRPGLEPGAADVCLRCAGTDHGRHAPHG